MCYVCKYATMRQNDYAPSASMRLCAMYASMRLCTMYASMRLCAKMTMRQVHVCQYATVPCMQVCDYAPKWLCAKYMYASTVCDCAMYASMWLCAKMTMRQVHVCKYAPSTCMQVCDYAPKWLCAKYMYANMRLCAMYASMRHKGMNQVEVCNRRGRDLFRTIKTSAFVAMGDTG